MTEGAIGDVNFNSCIIFSPLHNKRAVSEETALSCFLYSIVICI
nr:MAG TPA: hypothetical protein [Caudoviricetes sp.]